MGQRNRIDRMPINDVEVYRAIYDKLPQGVVVVRNDQVQYANQALSEIAGVPLETIMTWSIDDILGVLTEDHEGTVKSLYRETALGHREEGILRFAFARPDGQIRFIEVIPTIIHSEDEQIYHAIIADVTKRVEAENALRESEEQFRRTFDAIPDPAYLWQRRKDGEIVLKMVNEIIVRYSRGMIDQYIDKTPEELLPDSPEMTLSVRRTMETGEGLRKEMKLSIPTVPDHGEDRWVIADYAKPADDLVLMITTDITELFNAEAAVRESEERLEFALKGADLGLWDWNVQTDEMILNERWTSIFGYAQGEFDPTLEGWERLVHPDDLPWVSEVLDDFLEGKSSYDVEYRARTRSGDLVWVLDRGKIMEWDSEGKPLRAVGTLMDITERKRMESALQESEERYRMMADNILDGVTIIEGSPVVYVNDRTCEIFGYPREEMIELGTLDLVAPEDRERVGRVVMKAMETGEYPDHLDFQAVRKDGTRRHVSNRFSVSLKEDGTVVRYILTTDITERMKAYEATSEARARAELFNDLMAHDLNNIHQGIMSSLELTLLSPDVPPEFTSQVEVALQQVKRGVDIIANVRKYSRVAEEPLKLTTTDVEQALRVSEQMVRDTFPTKELRVNTSLRGGEIRILADEFLVDAFFNILHNAVKHDKRNRVTVDIKARFSDDKKAVEILFEDHGPGINDTRKATLFSRVEPNGDVGVGIGLTLVQRIINRYGGEVKVEDRVKGNHSKGACFVIRLPLVG
jgi:PAS domain S-box-containing protein